MTDNGVAIWYDDGHTIDLTLRHDTVLIESVYCPNAEDRACVHVAAPCVVEWFLQTYGFDCHVGVCAPTPVLPIAWSIVGDPTDLNGSQVWFVATTDAIFASWRATQDLPETEASP